MRTLTKNMIAGFFFVAILGTLWHFLYDWTGQNPIIGFIAPINESTFEHMKLIFFPALFYLPVAVHFLKDDYPNILSHYTQGIICGTSFIPVFFYTYTGILGFNVMWIDIGSFYLATLTVFCACYRMAVRQKDRHSLGTILCFVFFACFILFTYRHPEIGIFRDMSR